MDLRDASHEQAVEAIRKAGNPVVFMVQSIINRPRVSEHKGQGRHTETVLNLESNKARTKLFACAPASVCSLRRYFVKGFETLSYPANHFSCLYV